MPVALRLLITDLVDKWNIADRLADPGATDGQHVLQQLDVLSASDLPPCLCFAHPRSQYVVNLKCHAMNEIIVRLASASSYP